MTIPVTLQIFAAGDSDGDSLPDTWETRYGWTPGNTNLNQAASGDPDGDGVTNLMEYLLDLNPELADNQQMPAASTTVNPADDDPYLTYCYRRRVGVSGLVYTVQVSSILGSWVSGPAETEEISVTPNAGGESETVVVRIKPAMNAPGHNKKFVRLQVTTP